jgi:ABC-type Co2+ transport system permease subunit
MSNMFDFNELVKRAIKYLIEGLAVAVVALLIPKKPLNVEEIVIIALTAAAVFSILDVFIPAAGVTSRQSVGAAAGINLMGGLRMVA